MKQLLALFLLILMQACASGPQVSDNYNRDSKVVLVNGISPKVTYAVIGAFSRDEESYPVDWGVPELIEQKLREATSTQLLRTATPSILAAVDLDDLRKELGGNSNSEMKETLSEICTRENADVALVLGTKYAVWNIGGLSYKAGGYGVFRGSMGGANAEAYALVGAGIIDCTPLRFTSAIWVQQKPVSFKRASLPRNPRDLSATNLSFIRPHVMEALVASADNRNAPLAEQIAKGIDELFKADGNR